MSQLPLKWSKPSVSQSIKPTDANAMVPYGHADLSDEDDEDTASEVEQDRSRPSKSLRASGSSVAKQTFLARDSTVKPSTNQTFLARDQSSRPNANTTFLARDQSSRPNANATLLTRDVTVRGRPHIHAPNRHCSQGRQVRVHAARRRRDGEEATGV